MYNPLVAPSPLAARYGGIGHGKLSVGVPDFPRLLLDGTAWYRSDRLITLNGSTVSAWGDLTGNGNTATQDTEANQPTYTQSAIGGKPALQTDGGDILTVSDPTYSTDTVFVLFAGHLVPDGTTQNLIQHYNATGDQRSWRIWLIGSNRIQVLISSDGTSANTDSYTHTETITEGDYAVSFRFDANLSAASRLRISINGSAEDFSNSFSSLHNSTADLRIFDSNVAANSSVAEGSLIDTSVSNAEFLNIEQYAMNRYGITLA